MYDVMRMRGKLPSLVRSMRVAAVTTEFRYCAIQKYSALIAAGNFIFIVSKTYILCNREVQCRGAVVSLRNVTYSICQIIA
jgi:hypothetical protein